MENIGQVSYLGMDVGVGAQTLKYISFMMNMILCSLLRLEDWRWAGHVIKMEESDPAKKVLCTKPGGNGDRRKGRPKLRWCYELQDYAQNGVEIGELISSEERSGGKSLRRSLRTQGYCKEGRRNNI
jgi:hypothetical protein